MVYLNGSHSPLNVIIRQTVYISCSIKAGAEGFALYRCPFHHVHHHHVHHVLKFILIPLSKPASKNLILQIAFYITVLKIEMWRGIC